jgi:hypothetical protein
MLYEKEYKLLSQYLSIYSKEKSEEIFSKLLEIGLISTDEIVGKYEFSKYSITPSFLPILVQGDFFDELLQSYPTYVTRPDGSKDYLRMDLQRCRKYYSKVTGNKLAVHRHILECLQFEVTIKRREGKLCYMKRLPKWLASEEWKCYEQMMKDVNLDLSNIREEDLGYGNNLE